MKSRQVVISALAFACGCGSDGLLVPPTSPTTQAALVVWKSQPAFAFAVDLSEPSATIELPERTNDAPLFVSLYSCSLETLALPSGSVPLRDSAGRRFPAGDHSYRSAEDEDSGWISVSPETLGTALDPLRLDQDEAPPCNDFPLMEATRVSMLGPQQIPERFVGLENGGGLLAVPDSLHWVTPEAALLSVTHPLFVGPDAAITFGDPDEVLIVPSSGPMLSGHPDRGLRVFGPAPPNATPAMMLARSPRSASSFELFVFSAAGLARFDGVTWSMLDSSPRAFTHHARLHGAWIRPGEAAFLAPDQNRDRFLLHWRDGAFATIELPDVPRSLASGDEGQVYVGTENGALLRMALDRPEEMERVEGWSRPTRPIWVIRPLEDSVFISGWSGHTNEYFPGRGYCSEAGFTPELLGASLVDADFVGVDGQLMAVGMVGGTESMTRVALAKFGRSSALPSRCRHE